jgi:hypothetical protein
MRFADISPPIENMREVALSDADLLGKPACRPPCRMIERFNSGVAKYRLRA